ncbi:MAG: FimB/Mfa2 family fimbrial subunit [Proteiniphilum sp.]|jgi:hypothetical protein|nr:FimB/Mfa2 family fimbrial subunit [Proteiniphilum sp.]
MKLITVIPLFTVLVVCSVYFLSSCSAIDDDLSGCGADMQVSFYVDDRFEAGDFDARIGNDVLLYIFQNDICVEKDTVPYSQIAQGGSYTIHKTDQISGNLQMVAWAVPANATDADVVPAWPLGYRFGSGEISLQSHTRLGFYAPITKQLYLGMLAVDNEKINEPTSHPIGMNYSYCRVEVRITDPSGSVLSTSGVADVHVLGSMSRMNRQLQGTGDRATVLKELGNPSNDSVSYTTGRFGILPSSSGETISIEIYAGDVRIATLTGPNGAEAGGLMIFEYTLDTDSFTLIVDGYRVNVYNVDRV